MEQNERAMTSLERLWGNGQESRELGRDEREELTSA
jgi:hypothetical protein